MIDGSTCSRMKFASLVVNYTILSLFTGYNMMLFHLHYRGLHAFPQSYTFHLSATLPNLRRVHLFWPPWGDRGPRSGGVPGGGFGGGAGGDRKGTRLKS